MGLILTHDLFPAGTEPALLQRIVRSRILRCKGHGPAFFSGEVHSFTHHSNIFRFLVFEYLLFGRRILLHVGIPIEMIGCQIQINRDMRPEHLDALQLKRTHFNNDPVEFLCQRRNFTDRPP